MLLIGCDRPAVPMEDGKVLVRITALAVPDTPWHAGWTRFLERLAASPAADDVLPKMYIFGQLGSEETMLTNLRRGRIQVGGFSLQGLASMVPEISILLAPYLFDSHAEADFVIDEYLTRPFAELFAAQGAQLIAWSEVGWTHLYSVEPIEAPEDVRGMPMRSSTALGARAFGSAMAMDMIAITFPEVLPALQTGLIEGGQSSATMFALGGLAREAKHLTLTQHAFDTGLIIANRRWFESLSPQTRSALVDSFDPAPVARAGLRDVESSLIETELAEQGVRVNWLSDRDRDAWRQPALRTHPQLIEEIGGEAHRIYAIIQVGKADFRARKSRALARKSPPSGRPASAPEKAAPPVR